MANHVSQLVRDLGKGETAVILHGLKHPGALVVLDDLLARRVAKQMELFGFHLASEHRAIILKQAGEK